RQRPAHHLWNVHEPKCQPGQKRPKNNEECHAPHVASVHFLFASNEQIAVGARPAIPKYRNLFESEPVAKTIAVAKKPTTQTTGNRTGYSASSISTKAKAKAGTIRT